MVRLRPVKAGAAGTLTIQGENTITVRDVVAGEVWLCSGQSNMGFQLNRALTAAEAIAGAADPQLRFFKVPREAADSPKADTGGAWELSTPLSASNVSAVAYFFGRDLRRALKVPVGLIDSAVGGTPAEAWTSRATLESNPVLKELLDKHAQAVARFAADKASGKHDQLRARHREAVQQAKAAGKPAPKAPVLSDPSTSKQRPCGLYNAMIAPLQPYPLAGAIWYQGEANSGRATQYLTLFPAMIGNWREAWGDPFPFLFVQIAPHERMTPEIREAQLLCSQKVPRTACIVTADVGDAKDIHPRAKEPVGARLALAARAIAYGEKIPYSGPVLEKMEVDGTRAVLSFRDADGGLVARDGLKGFTIAGADGNFVEGQARIEGNRVVVSSPAVPKPAAVRYGWSPVPEATLFNGAGLPASPFRTDGPK
jgi:sialate O-acetylesterase